ncbi:hypothetical protein KSP40_PGU010632 [Platanthera guangdongensis]|uniref:Uncharacterized protein n=1 Tax=Platanthera guangdongensis TaxID=2320717 RepID=A0ABR2N4S5_9ASPA
MAEFPHSTTECGVKNKDSLLSTTLLSPGRKSSPASAIPGIDTLLQNLCFFCERGRAL